MVKMKHHRLRNRMRWAPLALAGTLLAAGCAAPAPAPQGPAATVVQHDSGFVITEDVHVGAEARAEFERAVLHLQQEEYAPAIALLRQVTQRAPEATAAHIDLGIAYRETGDLGRAEASITRALELNPQHPVAHNELGMLHRRAGRFEDARRHYEQALAAQPAFHYARLNLAILCDIYLADLGCALAHYEAYAEAVPGDAEATMWLADLRQRAGRQE
jgi:tetratricopeptide (TPR) repeat protein